MVYVRGGGQGRELCAFFLRRDWADRPLCFCFLGTATHCHNHYPLINCSDLFSFHNICQSRVIIILLDPNLNIFWPHIDASQVRIGLFFCLMWLSEESFHSHPTESSPPWDNKYILQFETNISAIYILIGKIFFHRKFTSLGVSPHLCQQLPQQQLQQLPPPHLCRHSLSSLMTADKWGNLLTFKRENKYFLSF